MLSYVKSDPNGVLLKMPMILANALNVCQFRYNSLKLVSSEGDCTTIQYLELLPHIVTARSATSFKSTYQLLSGLL